MTASPKPPLRPPPWAPCDGLAELARILEEEVPPDDENQNAPPV